MRICVNKSSRLSRLGLAQGSFPMSAAWGSLHLLPPFFLFALLFAAPLSAQEKQDSQKEKVIVCFGTILDGDTIPLFKLQTVTIRASYGLLTPDEIRKNQKLIRNVKKMLPYAKLGKQRLDKLEAECANLSAKQRKERIKQAEKEITDEFGAELKKCTISQGKVLLKLIDRETGRTSYVLVNELRGKLRASFYQTFAKLFGYNLKGHYDPKNDKSDELMERIVRSVELGRI